MRILLLFLLLLCSHFAQAQRYSELKLRYPPAYYHRQQSDAYDPVVCGLASSFLPGLGQMVAGEPIRGLCFLGATMGSLTMTLLGAVQLVSYGSDRASGVSLVFLGAGATIGVYVWSIVDAVEVAKVKNMAGVGSFSRVRIRLAPDLRLAGASSSPGLGMSCSVHF